MALGAHRPEPRVISRRSVRSLTQAYGSYAVIPAAARPRVLLSSMRPNFRAATATLQAAMNRPMVSCPLSLLARNVGGSGHG
jgi:hypothetical protein